MSVNSYLNDLAQRAIVRDNEKNKINISIENIKSKLKSDNEVKDIKIFGSYKRGTIISRKFDENSDIDIMVIFKDDRNKPQTYLNYLKGLIGQKYTRSEIHQDNPTIVLELNHIRFELVPALDYFFNIRYKIPAKQSDYADWLVTDPDELNGKLTNNQNLRRLLRVAKIWNIKQGGLFNSYKLEKFIVNRNYICNWNLADYFYTFCDALITNYNYPQYTNDKIKKLKDKTSMANALDAENIIKDLFE
nr:nucleotidyltransferase domain-containing protein [uncultured Campylobacter sp.]